MLRLGLLAALSFTFSAALAQTAPKSAADAGLVILVRHAEKQPEVSDPPLSEAGQARAVALREALRDLRLSGVIVSDARRTALTAEPIAAAQSLKPIVIATKSGIATHVSEAAQQARKLAEQGAVLIVGHSNTLPAIVKALGGPALLDLAECDYSALWVLHIRSDQRADLIQSRYGDDDVNCGTGSFIQ